MLAAKVIVFVIFSVISYTVHAEIDYCNKTLCPYQGKHIRCNNTGEFSKDCRGSFKLINMEEYKSMIVDSHNKLRNEMASGKLSCYHPACRMPRMRWDESLAKNAEFNVKTCKFAHDPCRSTPDWPFVGQNIYTLYTSKKDLIISDCIKEAIFLWWKEGKDANSSIMNSFTTTVPQTGHFATMMTDRQNRIGCACLDNMISINPVRHQIIFTCDYPSTNIQGYPSYKKGASGTCCKRRHPEYTNLCDNEIDPNDLYFYGN